MSKKSNPVMIGGFVVGAVVLLATGVALFGGSELFAKRYNYVAYFEEQTKGLRVGSNVILNGVRIGYVSENQELPGWMTVRELLDYLAPFYPTWDRDLALDYVRRLGLP